MKHAYNGNFLENQVINGVIVSTVGGLNISCDKCHGALSNYSSARHVNGKVEWDLSGISAGATYNGKNKGDTGNPALGTGFGSCTNLYCHSTVQPDGGVGGPTYQSATWGATATCGSCHVDMYTSPAATGGHKQHAQASGSFATPFDCRICHANGGSTNPQNHANGPATAAAPPRTATAAAPGPGVPPPL
jgi:predicted CxxxxCH...CXXCH cytochrome family protein